MSETIPAQKRFAESLTQTGRRVYTGGGNFSLGAHGVIQPGHQVDLTLAEVRDWGHKFCRPGSQVLNEPVNGDVDAVGLAVLSAEQLAQAGADSKSLAQQSREAIAKANPNAAGVHSMHLADPHRNAGAPDAGGGIDPAVQARLDAARTDSANADAEAEIAALERDAAESRAAAATDTAVAAAADEPDAPFEAGAEVANAGADGGGSGGPEGASGDEETETAAGTA